MSRALAIAWNYPALRVLYALPPHTAMLVDRAVIRFAETGKGELEWVPPWYRLRAGFYEVAFVVDPEQETMNILRLYRRAR